MRISVLVSFLLLSDSLGSFGKVSKIKRLSDDKILVWKEMNYAKMSDRAKKQLMREILILKELCHENIVRFIDK